MALKGSATTRTIQVWDLSTNLPIGGLAGSDFTLTLSQITGAGVVTSVSVAAADISAGTATGDYCVKVSAANNNYDSMRINGTVAGGYTVIGDRWDNEDFSSITAKTNLITSGNFTVVSPVSATGDTITLKIGDDYDHAHNTHIRLASADLPDLTDPSVDRVSVEVYGVGSISVEVDCTVVDASTIWYEPGAADTGQLTAGTWKYGLHIYYTDKDRQTPMTGKVIAVKVSK